MKIKLLNSSPYYAQANGQAEKIEEHAQAKKLTLRSADTSQKWWKNSQHKREPKEKLSN
jgi:hypothetical protein